MNSKLIILCVFAISCSSKSGDRFYDSIEKKNYIEFHSNGTYTLVNGVMGKMYEGTYTTKDNLLCTKDNYFYVHECYEIRGDSLLSTSITMTGNKTKKSFPQTFIKQKE